MIHWGTLLADPATGVIDYARVRSFVSVCLAAVAGIATVWVIFLARDVNEYLVGIMVAACVAPMTGGKIADGIAQRAAAATTARVVAGDVQGRRVSDSSVPPLPGGPGT
jgi:hypothetical protein